jgi:hypothetical protein
VITRYITHPELSVPAATVRTMTFTCEDTSTVGGVGCVRPAYHDGDHRSVEGATWPQLLVRDCPRCGGVMYVHPDTLDGGLPCPACQDELDPTPAPPGSLLEAARRGGW